MSPNVVAGLARIVFWWTVLGYSLFVLPNEQRVLASIIVAIVELRYMDLCSKLAQRG